MGVQNFSVRENVSPLDPAGICIQRSQNVAGSSHNDPRTGGTVPEVDGRCLADELLPPVELEGLVLKEGTSIAHSRQEYHQL